MLAYIGRRALLAIFTVWAISVLSFAIIQLPPGDYVTSYIAQMASMGSVVTDEEAQNLRIQYGLGQPIYVQYFKWMRLIVQGNFGMSMEWRRPVTEVIGERLWLTVVVSVAALILTWVLALPIGIYSAVRQYSVGDYVATFIGFIGLAVPNFLLALVLLYLGFVLFNAHIGGLFSPELQDAPWSLARVWDLLKHLPIPALILGLAGTAQQIRIMRANLLDELRKPYVVTARSKGLSEARVILKYPVRVALNPFASTIGYTLPYIVSGSIIVSLVLGSADGRAAPAQGPHRAGHVPGRDHRAPARRDDGDRHADLGHPAGVDRSAHPPRGDVMAEPEAILERGRAPLRGPAAVAARGSSASSSPRSGSSCGGGSASTRWRWPARVVVARLLPGRARRGLPRLRRPQRLRGAALAHAPAARLLVRRRALQPSRLRAQGRARPADLQARLSRGSRARRSRSGSSPRASSTASSA